MMGKRSIGVLTVAFLAIASFPAFADEKATEISLEEKVEILAEELASLREQISIPASSSELSSHYGLGPSASKVYGTAGGVSLGGYGEFYFASPIEDTELTNARNVADFYRFITYVGYKFGDRIVMNTEIEFEHATTSSNFAGKSGSISVEFSYLDFLINPAFNIRAGNLLIPAGMVNEMHEPPFYRGNFRPEIERRIIPSTWRELGIGIHGLAAEGLRYSAYVVNGLNGSKFSTKGVRDGRQKGNRALWEDIAGILSLDYDHNGSVQIGGSFFTGGADHDGIFDSSGGEVEVSNQILEAHVQCNWNGLKAKALVAKSTIDGAEELSLINYDADDLVPEEQFGFYLEAAYDIAPKIFGEKANFELSPWFRYEDYDLQQEVPAIAGRSADGKLAVQSWTLGLELKPHPQVVLKADYFHSKNDADAVSSDELRFGAGFVY